LWQETQLAPSAARPTPLCMLSWIALGVTAGVVAGLADSASTGPAPATTAAQVNARSHLLNIVISPPQGKTNDVILFHCISKM
jgi:hypothetical protein